MTISSHHNSRNCLIANILVNQTSKALSIYQAQLKGQQVSLPNASNRLDKTIFLTIYINGVGRRRLAGNNAQFIGRQNRILFTTTSKNYSIIPYHKPWTYPTIKSSNHLYLAFSNSKNRRIRQQWSHCLKCLLGTKVD